MKVKSWNLNELFMMELDHQNWKVKMEQSKLRMKVGSFKLKDENEFKKQGMKLVSSNFKVERIFLKIHEWGSQKSMIKLNVIKT